MNIKRSVLSLFLILAMLVVVPASASRNVLASVYKGEITNIKIDSKGYMKWDAIPNADHYRVKTEAGDFSAKKPEFDLYNALVEHGIKSGTYEIVVSGYDKNNDHYSSKTSYTFVSPDKQLPSVTNIKISGDYLTWNFNRAAVPGATPTFSIRIYGPDDEFNYFETKQNNIPKSSFAVSGTHDYHITISSTAPGFVNSEKVEKTLTGVTASNPTITGFNYSHGIVSWNKIPGAESYHVEVFYYQDSKHKAGFITRTDSNYISIGANLRDNLEPDKNSSHDMAVTVWAEKTSNGTEYQMSDTSEYECVYKYEEFPLKVYGETVSTKMDTRNLLGNGEVEYNPDANKLTFKGKSFEGSNDRWKDKTVFATDESLVVAGSANVSAYGTLFKTGGTVLFDTDCSITAYTRYKPVVEANQIVFKAGNNNTFTSDTNTLEIQKNINFSKNITSLTVKTSNPNRAAILIEKGQITLPDGLGIIEPNGGRLSDDSKTILNKDGSTATNVVIRPVAPTAAPSSVPTAEPTGSEAKPTGKATATPAPDATAAPTTKVTTAPKPTSSVDSTADPNAQILAFVERIYIYVLDREPEAEGAAFWSEELYSFRRTGAEVAQGFIFSAEFEARNTTDEEFVTILYKTFFGRDPEEDGMNFWLDQLATGAMDRTTVANGFIYSQEWADTCASYGIRSGGDLKPSGSIEPTDLTYAFVERMYTTAMGRGYDEEGKQYWASELANFNITGEQCGASFFLSDEMTGYGLSDEEFLGRLYATFMNREADEDGASYWIGIMASGTTRADVIFGFTRSAEFTDKCIEARILPY